MPSPTPSLRACLLSLHDEKFPAPLPRPHNEKMVTAKKVLGKKFPEKSPIKYFALKSHVEKSPLALKSLLKKVLYLAIRDFIF